MLSPCIDYSEELCPQRKGANGPNQKAGSLRAGALNRGQGGNAPN